MGSILADRNWRITRLGMLVVILLGAGYLGYTATDIPIQQPLYLTAAAGVVFAVSIRVKTVQQFKPVVDPLAGFLVMAAGGMTVWALLQFFTSSIQIGITVLEQFDGSSIIGLLQAVVVPVTGYSVLMFGSFLLATGIALVSRDRLDEDVYVGVARQDFLFTGILTGLTAIGIAGTAFLRDISVIDHLRSAASFVTSTGSYGPYITAVLLPLTYAGIVKAWHALPIRNLVQRSQRDVYDALQTPERILRWVIVPLASVGSAVQGFIQLPVIRYLPVLATAEFRTVLGIVLLLSTSSYVVVKVLKGVASGMERLRWLLPYILFGVAAYTGAPFLTGHLDLMLSRLPGLFADPAASLVNAVGRTQFVMILMTVGSFAATVLKIVMDMLRGFGIIPEGLKGTTMMAAGVFFAAIGRQLYRPDAVLLFIGVGTAMVVWELGKRSVLLGYEIGHSASTVRPELVRGMLSVVIAFIAVVVARAVHLGIQTFTFPTPPASHTQPIFLLAVLGVGFLIAALRNAT